MVAGALLPPYGGLTANVSAPYMAAAYEKATLPSRNSLEWSDTTIRNQAALNGPMEAVNRRHARFAGSKFKARYATGTIVTEESTLARRETIVIIHFYYERPTGDSQVIRTTINAQSKAKNDRRTLKEIDRRDVSNEAAQRGGCSGNTNDRSLIRPNERRRRCGRAIKSEMGEAIDKYIKADRNARFIETKEEGRLTDLLADRVVVVLGPPSGPLEIARAMRNCRFSHEALVELPGPQCSVAALQRCSRARKCA
ncbi:hypothetical protein ALC56_04280 [Trachymyrmex septentrionalis]|uniref:Uncharacterized protein n=1 Tax=Trachymyrmex septentrionalis TaxID=34720 RepID=A0A195FMD9_9HYME|nr:hypothetical protein ALC56_04280 [Trachymyrmex septentrionalis]